MRTRDLASMDLSLLCRPARGTDEMRASAVLDGVLENLDPETRVRARILAERLAQAMDCDFATPGQAQRARVRLLSVLSEGVR